ncbi:MAG: sugar nucleotide-binding protein [Bacteroidetes bacterium]|nr:sugar nucleotide-binding protein [Bacteroidota bacterium]
MKTITVIGAKGMLGYAVAEYLESCGYHVQRISHDDHDILNDPFTHLEPLLTSSEVIVNCAGIIKQKIHQYSSEDVFKVNSIFPRTLSLFCKRASVPFIHISSERVFSGERGKYSEDDISDAADIFGISKSAGEPRNCMVLRTSIIGEEREESHSLTEWAKHQHGRTVDGIVNHYWNGVTNVHLAEIIEKILMTQAYAEGVFHLFSPNSVSKKELLEIINEAFQLNLQIEPIEAVQLCDRTLISNYSLSKFYCTKTIQMQVYEMKEFYDLMHAPVLV